MQYVLKLTPIGVKHHVFRVVSVDGMADVEHVLSLCNLSFDYANYDTKELYFASDAAAFKALSVDVIDDDDQHFGPTGNEFAAFWESTLDLASLNVKHFKLAEDRELALGRFDELIERMQSSLNAATGSDMHPGDQVARFKFIYRLNGVKHLVEIMMSSEKLNCFVPATLMGEGLIEDNDEAKPLSAELINECIAAHDDDESLDEGLNLKNCTSRMRALGALRGQEHINNAMLQAGATPLTFVAE